MNNQDLFGPREPIEESWAAPFARILAHPITQRLLDQYGNTSDERAAVVANYIRDQDTQYGFKRSDQDERRALKSSFQYAPLVGVPSDRQFRLIKILPAKTDGKVHIELQQHDLINCPVFDAISYCWGKRTAKIPVVCNGSILLVSPTVASALSRLRLRDRTSYLWCDAVCINQNDVSERQQQVQIMQRIYGKANQVIVWLQSEDRLDAFGNFSRIAFDGLRYYSKIEVPSLERAAQLDEEEGDSLQCKIKGFGNALDYIVNQAWFERIWCVQEVVVARRVTVLCGPDEISWKTFRRGLSAAVFWDARFSRTVIAVQRDDHITLRLKALAEPVQPEANEPSWSFLLRLLVRYRSRKSTDPRDKVYALLGLVLRHYDQIDVSPSYEASKADLYIRIALLILRRARDLRLLQACCSSTNDQCLTLPSWAPDWAHADSLQKPLLELTDGSKRDLRASRCSVSTFRSGPNSSVIGVSGHIIDSVQKIGDILPLSDSEGMHIVLSHDNAGLPEWDAKTLNERLVSLLDQIKVFQRWERISQVRQDSTDSPSTFWQTLCAGKFKRDHTVTAELYQKWIASLTSMRTLLEAGIRMLDATDSAGAAYQFLPMLKSNWSTWLQNSEFTDLLDHSYNRRFAVTYKGYHCLTPPSARKSDMIAVFRGGDVPFVIREYGDDWKLIGEAYVHGIMDGEAFRESACKTFWLH